jgi:ribosomal protein L11 methyltransferase
VAHVRRELSPVEAGRFFVYGSHDADKVPAGCEPLLIEAAMAFGTGHHGTTLGCLKALDRLAEGGFTGRRVVDVGCGTAVLAMAAARIWEEEVLASDIDEVAVEVAEANVTANGLTGRVRCLEAAGFDHPDLAAAAPFDLVFANILKGPLVALAPDMAGALQPAGYAILSGILNEQADDVIAVYAQNGINLTHREEIGDWTTLTLQKKT